MMKNIVILTLLALFILPACDKTSNNIKPEEEKPNPFKAAIVEQNNNFSLEIFKEITGNEESNTNIFISPLSMYYALSMAATGSATETKQEFVNLLGWQDKTDEEVLSAIKELSQDLTPSNANVILKIANSLWQRQGAPIKQSYKDQTQEYFDAEVRELDFNSPEAVEVINSWIEVKTNDLIQDMLDQISPDAIMYLINAIYYKADWKYKFDEEDSFEGNFMNANNQEVNATFMTQKTNLDYLSNDLFTSVKLPYIDSNFYMTILLPKDNFSTNDILDQMNSSNWSQWQSEYQLNEVTVTLPRFKYEFGVRNINAELQAMGLVKAFSRTEADFSLISNEQIYISRVLHKAYIEVNEEGSEAAAATIIEIIYTSIGEDIIFNANKAFVFTICHKPTNSILFMGKLSEPQ
ncbi:MAG: serpin family protein [Salinivirgaceae bacterium]|nr:serpin family protein [Salinivirgaceae bacterium]